MADASRGSWIPFWLGLALWLALRLATAPAAATFFDEVGYSGQARLFAAGSVHATPTSPGVWFATAEGLEPLYPPGWSIVQAPFVLASPRFATLPSALAAALATFVFALLLREGGAAPVWGLVLLAHPTVSLFSRVAMPDVATLAAVLLVWLAVERRRPHLGAAAAATAILLKPTGLIPIAAYVAIAAWKQPEDRPAVFRVAVGAGAAALLGLALPSAYATSLAAKTPFSPAHLASAGSTLLLLLATVPPLLLLGAIPLLRARRFAALAAALALIAVLSGYYFIDRGRSILETLVVGPRLALPAVGILLVGWTLGLSQITRRLPSALLATGCIVLPLAVQGGVAAHQARVLDEVGRTRSTVDRIARLRGAVAVDVTPAALKALTFSPLEVRSVASPTDAEIFVCATRVPSWREPGITVRCDTPAGWTVAEAIGPFLIQTRDED